MRKTALTIYLSLMSAVCCFPQGTDGNYVATRIMTDTTGYISHVQYYDGLGRESVSVTGASSGNSGSVATLTEYDFNGRRDKTWNPAPVSGSECYSSPSSVKSSAIGVYSDSAPFSLTVYDGSPLNRVTEQYGPGQSWHGAGKSVKTGHTVNGNDGYSCRRYVYDESDGTFWRNADYPAGTLDVEETTDEDGVKTQRYTDFFGHTVLLRKITGAVQSADTYYVYDGRGRLRYVLPPMLSARLSACDVSWDTNGDDVWEYGYFYDYDVKDRLVERKAPGCEPEYMVYNAMNDLIMTQDGLLRDKGKWRLRAYDTAGRPAYEAIVSSNLSRASMQQQVLSSRSRTAFGNGAIFGYTAVSYGQVSVTASDVFLANFYDSYAFLDNLSDKPKLSYHTPPSGYDARYYFATMPKVATNEKLTGTMARTLGSDTDKLMFSAYYYDYRGNVVQTRQMNVLPDGFDVKYSHYSYTGKPLDELNEHQAGEVTVTDTYHYEYDDMDRLVNTSISHNGQAALDICTYTYDAVGRLSGVNVASGRSPQTLSYNVRGQLTGINDGKHFRQSLYYEQPYADFSGSTSTPAYNGNVSAVEWQCGSDYGQICQEGGQYAGQSRRRSYMYSYDPLNRLAAATYSDTHYAPSQYTSFGTGISYSTSYTYDLNSNPTKIIRNGALYGSASYNLFERIDDMTITYTGNRISTVAEEAFETSYEGAVDFNQAEETDEYEWDANGNLKADPNRGISEIVYNLLNLPEKITLSNGNVIRYVYASDGRKLTAKYKVSNIHAIDDPIIGPLGMTGLLGSGAAGGMNGGGMVVDDDSIPGGFTPGGGNILPGGGTPLPLDSLDQVIVGEDMLDHANTRRRIDYCGSYIYKNGTLDKVLFDGGYIDRDGGYNYFIKDYQGNVRVVVNEQDSVVESDNYYPYGQLFTEGAPSGYSAQPWKYGGKELDREHGINEHDFEARRQMPQLGLFSTQDPLKWDNPDVSPYLYCAANPIRFTDPTGMKIEFANNVSEAFVKDYYVAYNFLKNNNASFVIDDLDKRENTYYIIETNNDSEFDSSERTIYWNPNRALYTDNIYVLTPAELLSHEADHALFYDINPESSISRHRDTNSPYGNKEDERVITGTEQEVAKKLGRLQEGESTRENHNGIPYNVISPDSDDIDGVVVINNFSQ